MSIRLLSSVPPASRPPILIGLAGLVAWALAERWLYAIKLQQGKGSSKDRGSFLMLYLSWYGSVIVSLLDAVLLRWSTINPAVSSVQFAGAPLVLSGLVVRVLARITLGKAFSPVVQTSDAHKLVTGGIYGIIRHPAYLGTLCLLIGFPLCFGSIIGLGIAFVVGIPVLFYRIQVEERALRAWFGGEYEEYSRKTHRLIPYLW